MTPSDHVHTCHCPQCLAGADHPDRKHHERMNLLFAMLDHQQRRVYAAIESSRIGRGGVRLVSLITGLSVATIGHGRAQLAAQPAHIPLTPDLRSGGRPSSEVKHPGIQAALEQILTEETAGDPMSEQVWVRNSVEQISRRLKEDGFDVCGQTVWRLLRRMKFSMKYSKKRRAGSGHNSPEREEQFGYIAARRTE